MSQKLGFPYFGTSLNTLIFFVGFILSLLVFIVTAVAPTQALILGFLDFLGVLLTGWALIGYAVNKDMLEGQRFIAIFFALLVLTGLFAVYLLHPIGITLTI
jgi:hypothetical protein